MADDDSTNTPEPDAETPTAPEPPNDVDALRAALAKANDDAKRHRLRNKELEPLAERAKQLEESQKTETERLTERLTAAEKRALDAVRYEVALDKGLTRSQAKRLVGNTPEELAADADELLADLGHTEATPPVTRRPAERLRGGSEPEQEPEEKDVRKIGERMFSR